MTEAFPTPATTPGVTQPLPPLQPEAVTYQDVMQAGPDDIQAAAFEGRVLAAKEYKSSTTQEGRDMAQRRKAEAKAVGDLVDSWQEDTQARADNLEPTETFTGFIDRHLREDEKPTQTYEAAKNWIGDESYFKLVGEVISDRRSRELQEFLGANPRQPTPSNESNSLTQTPRERQDAIVAAQRNVEAARGVEVFEDVMAFAKGKTAIYTDMPGRGYSHIGDGGEVVKGNHALPQSIVQEQESDSKNWQNHLNEAVAFIGVTEADRREITRVRSEPSRFGRSKQVEYTDTEEVPGSEHPVLIRNPATGEDEPLVRFNYKFKYSSGTLLNGNPPRYREAMGARDGNTVGIGIDMPKSLADKLQAQIEADPASVRSLVQKLFVENSTNTAGKNLADRWTGTDGHNPSKPPYDELPKDWKIAVIKGDVKTRPRMAEQVLRYDINRRVAK